MPPTLATALSFALIPAGVALVGAVIATIREPSPRLRTYIEHFAAGVVAAVAAAELLPEAVRTQSPLAIAIGFGLGAAAMLLIAHLSEGGPTEPPAPALPGELGESFAAGRPMGMVVPVAIDVLIDGLLLGLAFVATPKAGILLAIGFALEMLSLGLATSATCRRHGWSIARTFATVVGISACLVLGAAIAAGLLAGLSGAWLTGVIAFGLAALLYLVTEELLVEAHEVRETLVTTAMFFVGFLALLMIDILS